jgi:hypothetical protein
MIFSNRGALVVKPVSQICKKLPQTTASYSGSHKILLRQILSWDCPFNTWKSKQFNLVSKALENMIRAYYILKLGLFYCFYWTMGDWSKDRLSPLKFRKRLPKPHDEIRWSSAYVGKMDSSLAWIGTTHKGLQRLPNHALNFDGVLWQHFANERNWFHIENPPVCTMVAFKRPILKIQKLQANLSLDPFYHPKS